MPERWDRIEQVYHSALKVEESRRAAFLKDTCGEDENLRREVESLLAGEKQAENFLEAPALELAAKALAAERTALHHSASEDRQLMQQTGRKLESGTQLGDYEIQSLLGAGGMGEVYRARDLRLRRDVAIKVLPPMVSNDPERLRRFEQEATAAAALSHPNILAVYRLGTYAGAPYLVSELLHGETLREQLRRGRIAFRRAVDYAIQIARGLGAAHEKGIVHRDLKPENLFITKDGRVKILDFGLAKLTQAPMASEGNVPTMSGGETEPGLVLGTVGYMSPEQVRAQATDHRTDIFAMGAILYEVLSGQRAFRKASAAETMNAIVNEEPLALSQLTPQLPLALQHIVQRCLEKNPEQRFQSVADIGFAIEALSDTMSSAITPKDARSVAKWHSGVTVGLVLAVLVAAWFAQRAISRRHPNPTFHQTTYRRGTVYSARLSSDNRAVTYSAAWDGGPAKIYVASKEFPESRPLDVQQSALLSVSPLGELAILSNARPFYHYDFIGTLATMPLSGGAPRPVLQNVTGADWAPDGHSLAAVHLIAGRSCLEYPIGKVLFETTGWISYPRVSHDGKMVAFLHHPLVQDDRGTVMVVDQEGRSRILSGEWEAEQGLAWSAVGDEVWFSAARLANIHDVHAVTLSGQTRDVLAGPGGIRLLDIGSDGRLLVSRSEIRYVVAASIAGAHERDLSWLDTSITPNLSRDGKLILFSDISGSGGLYSVLLRNTDGSPVVRLGDGLNFSLSPDGTWAFDLLLKDPPEIELLPTGPGDARRLEDSNIESYVGMGWMPNSKEFIFAGNEPGHGNRFYIQSITKGKARPLTPEGFSSVGHSVPIAPDGTRFVAFDEHNRAWNVCQVENSKCALLPGSEEQDNPVQWSVDGKYIYTSLRQPVPSFWRIELSTGYRKLWKPVAVSDLVGANEVLPESITPDGRSFAYRYSRRLDELYLVDGLK